MTIEIRELVIEARVVDNRHEAASGWECSMEQEQLIESIVRRVLERLQDEREPWE